MIEQLKIWAAGARPRTLPAAFAPILAGVAVAAHRDIFNWPLALLALIVALALQIGVNYANDYSDGIRGTDEDRIGPRRLVASGMASPETVKWAAIISLAVAAVAGLIIVIITGHWWLLLLGATCLVAAWGYTGGEHPYGYLGLGELFVFVFFGLVAVTGTGYVIGGTIPLEAWVAGVAIGSLASALLVVNNLRDLAGDAAAGKRTLATRIDDSATRWLYVALVVLSAVAVVGFAALTSWTALLALLGLGVLIIPIRSLLAGARGKELIPMLQATSLAELGVGFGLLVGVVVG